MSECCHCKHSLSSEVFCFHTQQAAVGPVLLQKHKHAHSAGCSCASEIRSIRPKRGSFLCKADDVVQRNPPGLQWSRQGPSAQYVLDAYEGPCSVTPPCFPRHLSPTGRRELIALDHDLALTPDFFLQMKEKAISPVPSVFLGED